MNIPAELIAEKIPTISDMPVGTHGWAQVWADVENNGFVFAHDPFYEAQGEFWPHLVFRSATGYKARLMTQRVKSVDRVMLKSKTAIILKEVEL